MAKKFATWIGAKTYYEIPALMAIPEKGKNGRGLSGVHIAKYGIFTINPMMD